MKKVIFLLAIGAIPEFYMAQLTNKVDSVSYLIGTNIGTNIVRQMPEANKELLLQGLRDMLEGKEPVCADQGQVNAYFQEKTEKESAGMKAEGLKFLEENKKNPKVKVTSSGLQYEVMKWDLVKNPQLHPK